MFALTIIYRLTYKYKMRLNVGGIMLSVFLGNIYLILDFFIAGLLAFFACINLHKNNRVASKVFAYVGIIISIVIMVAKLILNITAEFWISTVYELVLWIVILVLNIRVIRGTDVILCIKTFYALPALIIVYGFVIWFDLLPYLIINLGNLGKADLDHQILRRLIDNLQYLIYGGILSFAILRYVKKRDVPISKTKMKPKVLIASVLVVSILLIICFIPYLVIGDVSSSLGTPVSLIEKAEGYYDNAYNAVRMERLFRSQIIGKDIATPGMYSYYPDLQREIEIDSYAAILNWIVIAMSLGLCFKIQKLRHEQNLSAYFTNVLLGLCMLGVFLISYMTALLGFIYVPFSFVIAGTGALIIYKTDINRIMNIAIKGEKKVIENGPILENIDTEANQNTYVQREEDQSKNNSIEITKNIDDRYCFKCGNELKQGSLFCGKCGASLK